MRPVIASLLASSRTLRIMDDVHWVSASANGHVPRAEFGVNAYIVVGKFTHLSVIDSNNLRLLIASKAQEGEDVHNPQYDGLHGRQIRYT